MSKIYTLLGLVLLLSSCDPNLDLVNLSDIEGMKPIYISEEDNKIELQDPRPFGELGKIVYYSPFIFINEKYRGIHVINNTIPSNPEKTSFINIPGNTDFTFNGSFLYANKGDDLVTIALTESSSAGLDLGAFELSEASVSDNVFSTIEDASSFSLVPSNYSGYFECADPKLGVVVAWELDLLNDP